MPIHLVGERKKEKERVREIQWESEKPTDIVCETDIERENPIIFRMKIAFF